MRTLPRLTAALLGLSVYAASITPARAQVAVAAPPAPLMVAGPAAPPAPPTTPAPTSSTSGSADSPAILVGAILGVVAADVAFSIYDGVRAGEGAAPTRGVGIAQAVVASPQVLGFGVFHIIASHDGNGDGPETAGLVFLPGVADALFVHGIWASQTPSVPPGVLLGVSTAVGFDTALTASILARAAGGHLQGRPMGVVQMLLTAPQIAASSYGLARDPHNTGGWAALTAWSGAIFTHGLVSAIAGGRSAPPVEAVPVPPPVPERPTLLVPASVHLGPVPMAGGGGIALGGQWL